MERRAEEEEEGSVAVESEVRVRATERRREKNYHNIYASAIVTVHTILHSLMWVFFWPKSVTFSILQNFPQADVVALTISFYNSPNISVSIFIYNSLK